jgi:hypothetical protein
MRIALSMLLGEHVEATQVEHSDVLGFQIVCPCCREAVFKVARTERHGGSQFFSHRAARAGTEDCERRVAGLSGQTILSYDAASRGQTLKAFGMVLRQAIDLDIYAHSGRDSRAFHDELAKLPGVGIMCRTVGNRLRALDMERDLDGFTDSVVRVLGILGWKHTTVFATAVQKRIAIDLMRHLVTHQGQRSRDHLVRHSIGLLRSRHDGGGRLDESDRSGRLNVMDVLPAVLNRSGRVAYAKLDPYFDAKLEGHDKSLYDRFEEHVIASMLSTLIRLPYHRMLRNHRSGLSPVKDIEPTLFLSLERADPDPGEPAVMVI